MSISFLQLNKKDDTAKHPDAFPTNFTLKTPDASLKVLICDDDPEDRKLVRAFLWQSSSGREITVHEAGQQKEIQAALDTGDIDLILMDIQMPGKSGMQWLKDIVEREVAPVIMLTGFGDEELAVQALLQGATSYRAKSKLSSEKLLNNIDKALKKWAALKAGEADREELERRATIDALTGLNNRRAIIDRLDDAIKRANRFKDKFSVIMLDIDCFKHVNDTYGHMVGDDVLERVASILSTKIRSADMAGRYGGDEFFIILPQTDIKRAARAAERIRKLLSTTPMDGQKGQTFNITISEGLTDFQPGDDACALISRADKLLYQAKHNGKNRVEFDALNQTENPLDSKQSQIANF
jgi:two-component system, cell cycle response regulator